jgi:hypothetical protein
MEGIFCLEFVQEVGFVVFWVSSCMHVAPSNSPSPLEVSVHGPSLNFRSFNSHSSRFRTVSRQNAMRGTP